MNEWMNKSFGSPSQVFLRSFSLVKWMNALYAKPFNTANAEHHPQCGMQCSLPKNEIYAKYKLKHIFQIWFSCWRTVVGIVHTHLALTSQKNHWFLKCGTSLRASIERISNWIEINNSWCICDVWQHQTTCTRMQIISKRDFFDAIFI